jgi:hypothetical protein
LQDEGELVRFTASTKEGPEVLRLLGRCPHAKAENINRRELGKVLIEQQQHITTGDQDPVVGPSMPEYLLKSRQLDIQKALIDALTSAPTKNRHRGECLAGCRIGGKTSALPAGMQDDPVSFA